MPTAKKGSGFVDLTFDVTTDTVTPLMLALDTALNPAAIAGFLSGVIEPYIQGRAKDRFAQEGDDAVGAWEPLKPATHAIRAQQGYPPDHPINRRTGQLEDYITNSPGRLTVHALGATLTMPGSPPTGELRDKVVTAQQGRDNPRTVARPVMGLNETDLMFVLTELTFYVGGAAGYARGQVTS